MKSNHEETSVSTYCAAGRRFNTTWPLLSLARCNAKTLRRKVSSASSCKSAQVLDSFAVLFWKSSHSRWPMLK